MASAQQPRKIARVGFLGNSTAELDAGLVAAFLQGLRNHSYMEGQSVVVEFRWAEGNY